MRILIVGSDANAYSLAKSMYNDKNVDFIFVAQGCKGIEEFAQKVDIPETDTDELLDFAIANEISLTIVTSLVAIQNNISQVFADVGRLMLAPSFDAASIAIFKSVAKKTMYRLKIPTVKFGIFERENQAVEYADEARRAIVIKNDTHIAGERPIFATSFQKAKTAIEHCFLFPENKVIIEDYIDAKEVSLYFLTDGYTALPIGSCSSDENYAYPISTYSPDKYVSDELELKILNEVIYPLIDDMSEHSQPYCGILGVDLFVNEDKYSVIEFNPFFKQMHLQSILPLIKSNLYDLFLSAASGSLSDEYKYIDFFNDTSYTKIMNFKDKNCLKSMDDDKFSYSFTSLSNVIFTQKAKTLSKAKKYLDENVEFLKDCEA